MGWFSKLKTYFRSADAAAGTINDERLWGALSSEVAGVSVSRDNAQGLSALYACVQVISESLAMLPVFLVREGAAGHQRQDSHPLYKCLHLFPNNLHDAYHFRLIMTADVLLSGNAFAYVGRDSWGRVTGLDYLAADRVRIFVKDGAPFYEVRDGGLKIVFPKEKIFHLKNRSTDGLVGQSPIAIAKATVGFGLALQQHGNKLFENGTFASGILKTPAVLENDEARRRIVESFKNSIGGGVSKTGRVGLIEGGVDYQALSMNNRDAQFLEAKEFSAIEIARIFRVPPHMIQDLSKGASYSSIEHQSINFVQYTILPWAVLWEKAAKQQLLNSAADENIFLKFNENALLRGDLNSRTDALLKQLQGGIRTINEARALLDENPVKHPLADEVMVTVQAVPLDKLQSDEPEGDSSKNRELLRIFESSVRNRLERLSRNEENAIQRALHKEEGAQVVAIDGFYDAYKTLLLSEMEALRGIFGDSIQWPFTLPEMVQRLAESKRTATMDLQAKKIEAIERLQKFESLENDFCLELMPWKGTK